MLPVVENVECCKYKSLSYSTANTYINKAREPGREKPAPSVTCNHP